MKNLIRENLILNKALAVCLLLVTLTISCSLSTKKEDKIADADGWTITVNGKVGYPQQGQIIIQEIVNGSTGWQDTITLRKDNTFSKKIQLSQPNYYKINFYNRQQIDLILYKNNVEVYVDGNNATGSQEVKGSPEIDVIYRAMSMLQDAEASPAITKLNQDFSKAVQERDEKTVAQLQETYMQEIGKSHDKVAEMLKNEPASLGVIYFLQSSNSLDRDKYLSVYIDAAEKAKKAFPSSEHTKQFAATVDKMKITAIGQPAPEIALPDTTGQIVKLSSMKGKYVLVDFWAKWCGPCRQENPNVVKAFHKYKDKGFTVFGVSLDRSKQDWLRAIGEDKLAWTHVSDLKYWQSEAAKTYNISAIPFSLLLDPNGVIIAKNLRGKALENKLAELLEK